jgi:hypothetical protein
MQTSRPTGLNGAYGEEDEISERKFPKELPDEAHAYLNGDDKPLAIVIR